MKFFKSYKRIFTIFLLVTLSLVFTSCGKETERIIKHENMSMKLSKEYQKSTLANASWYYTSPDGLVLGIRSKKDDVEKSGLEANTAMDYAEAYIKANSIPGSPKVRNRKDYVYFQYNRKVSGTDYSYLTCIYDNEDEYWLVSFACYKELIGEYKSEFLDSADSVTFESKNDSESETEK